MPHRTILSTSERASLLAIARTVMPAGEIFPGAGEACVDKVDNFLAQLPKAASRAYRGLVLSIEAHARMTTGRGFASLGGDRRHTLLESWRSSDSYARRGMLRALLTPLKIAHYNDATFYQQIGCAFGVATPDKIEQPRYMTERVRAAADITSDEELEVDAVVIGTGAGGAVVARELAEQGHAVVMLEEGAYFTRKDFNGQASEMQRTLYRDMGTTGSIGNVFIPIPVGKSVGGSTTINSGTCFRVPDRVLTKWRDQYGLTEFTPDALAPHYERVEQVLGVAANDARYLGAIARVIARGCDRLGYSHAPLKRNAPECDGQGLCCFGCPTDAKRSTNISYVPLALKAGAELVTGVRVTRILTESGRAAGVVGTCAGSGAKLTVRARAVVVACGTFYTPLLLEASGLGGASGELGRNLSIHPAIAVAAEFGELIQAYNSVPQGYSIDEFKADGILFEGAMTPLDWGSSILPSFGADYVRMMERYDRLALFGCMIEDTSRGRVRSVRGRPLVTYVLNDADVARLKRAIGILGRVYFAAGAQRVFPLVHGFDEWRSEADMNGFRHARLKARDFDITAYHPLGTARLGRDPRSSVVNASHQVHDVPGLYVTDGSAVPSSLAVNPQLTIMALATRAAQVIGETLERTAPGASGIGRSARDAA